MIIAITGGAGFLGSALTQQLAARHTLYLLDLNPLPSWFPVGNAHFIQADVREFSDFFDCDLIIHAASPVGPVGILSGGGAIGPSMIQGVEQMIRWALAKQSKLFFISSSEVYGQGGRLLPEDAECVFRGPTPSIRNEYAQAKLLAEIIIGNTAKHHPQFSYQIVRPFNIAGPRQLPEKGFVLPRFIIQALADRALTVYGDGSQQRAFTHVRDIARGIVTVAQASHKHDNNVWNLGNPANCTTIHALAELVCRTIGKGSIQYCDPRELHGPWFTECEEKLPDISHVQSQLGWEPAFPLSRIIADSVAFWTEDNRYREYLDHI
ncbi:MAG: NAD(P)-dependent oxidoreductase [Acidobacteriaceae bacterium]|nr:NAD(P)-dependent oxidoreductase [Acidobacteriaceae bacterium]